MKTQKIISVIALLSLIIPASLWYGQNHGLLPVAAADEANLYDDLFDTLITIVAAVFLLVQGILIYSMFKFRRQKGDNTDGAPIHDNFLLEIVWTAVPTVLVIWVGIYSFDVYTVMQNGQPLGMMGGMSHQHAPVISLGMEAATADTLPTSEGMKAMQKSAEDNKDLDQVNIDIVGMQFAWIFSYPNTDVETSELHVPLGREVKLNLSAADVIHAFWVPQFRLKQDTIPGMSTHLVFTPNKLGEYPIVCAELCGSYHGGMRAQLFVDTPEDYEAWLKQEQEEVASSKDLKMAMVTNHDQILAQHSQKLGINAETMIHLNHAHPTPVQ
jgi:cytochrome c oxidase subunit II